MSSETKTEKYDEALLSILDNEKSILGFLSTVFNFLARRTDFYYVPEGPYENIGFPPGVAEELVIKILRKCDPKHFLHETNNTSISDVNDDIMCSTVAQEIEVIGDEDNSNETQSISTVENISNTLHKNKINDNNVQEKIEVNNEKNSLDDYTPPVIPVQKNSDAYNGAVRDKYSWSQTITELDVTIKLPPNIKSGKDLKVTINPGDICVQYRSGEDIIKDSFPYKIKAIDSFWSISEGRLMIHLEKQQERWWNSLLNNEEPIDLSKIDCSRHLDELPEEHIAKVRELQFNQEQKMKGLPTTDVLRNIEILKKAWNAEGSPFKGTEFDPSVLNR